MSVASWQPIRLMSETRAGDPPRGLPRPRRSRSPRSTPPRSSPEGRKTSSGWKAIPAEPGSLVLVGEQLLEGLLAKGRVPRVRRVAGQRRFEGKDGDLLRGQAGDQPGGPGRLFARADLDPGRPLARFWRRIPPQKRRDAPGTRKGGRCPPEAKGLPASGAQTRRRRGLPRRSRRSQEGRPRGRGRRSSPRTRCRR